MRDDDKYKGCMIGLALGDCLGYQVEFVGSMDEIRKIHGPDGVTSLPENAIVSDDTQMTMRVARALIASKPRVGVVEGDAVLARYGTRLSAEFVEWFRSQQDPAQARDPGNTCMAACRALASGKDWGNAGIAGSRGSGTAMRSAPIGLWFHEDVPNIVQYGIATAQITHADDVARCASVATALLCSVAMRGAPVGTWGHELMDVVGGISDEFSTSINAATSSVGLLSPEEALMGGQLGDGWQGHEAVACALYCCMSSPDDFRKAVLMAANTPGDSDTIACITGALMGARLGMGAIPKEWLGRVEHEEKLLGLADALRKGNE